MQRPKMLKIPSAFLRCIASCRKFQKSLPMTTTQQRQKVAISKPKWTRGHMPSTAGPLPSSMVSFAAHQGYSLGTADLPSIFASGADSFRRLYFSRRTAGKPEQTCLWNMRSRSGKYCACGRLENAAQPPLSFAAPCHLIN